MIHNDIQSGLLEITNNLKIPTTTGENVGVIMVGSLPFIHNFNLPGTSGKNLFIGLGAGNFTLLGSTSTDGSFNIALGQGALSSLTVGNTNIAIGVYSLASVTAGVGNIGIGYSTLVDNITGNYNLAIGTRALEVNTANENTAIGNLCLSKNTTGSYNVGIGFDILTANVSGSNNVGIGVSVLESNTESDNTAIGYWAMLSNIDGHHNTAIGKYALRDQTTGQGNTSIGYASRVHATSGDFNTSIGYQAGHWNLVGNDNVFIGNNAGYYETGSNKLFIDNADRTDESTARKGALIYGVFNLTPANQVLTFNAKVGIGTTNPTANLVVGNVTTSSSPTYTVLQLAQSKARLSFTTNDADPSYGGYIRGDYTTSTLLTLGTRAAGVDTDVITLLGSNVGVGTTTPNANAILDITSTTKAFMPPRMTTTQIAAIPSPTEGMECYDLTLHKMSYYNGTIWAVV